MLPVATKEGVVTPFSDALFTATSAVCVTGLVVHDTATNDSLGVLLRTCLCLQSLSLQFSPRRNFLS